jgi:hypothetical protein
MYSRSEVNRLLEGTFCIHLQGRRISQAINQHEAGNKQALLAWFILRP